VATARTQTPLRVHFIDVGQGDAILIQSPSGQNVVYDGGNRGDTTVEYLRRVGVTKVDLVIASHNHADHIGGLIDVVRQFRPRFYMDNGIPATTITYRQLLDAVRSSGAQLLEPTARRLSMGDVSLEVLPPPGIAAWEQNDNSVGIVVEHGSFRLSMAGDAEGRQWGWWLERDKSLRSVHVHKASHHGSRNGDIRAALARLSPDVVIVSVGAKNGYGYPEPEALRLYAGEGAAVYQTNLHGTVVVTGEPSGRYRVSVDRNGNAGLPIARFLTIMPSATF
jgi:beta-lactamase superfamily II metal-dependent hydrolase